MADREEIRRKVEALRRAGLAAGVRGDATKAADALNDALHAEILAEKAAAYGRAVKKVEKAVAALAESTAALHAATPSTLTAARRTWRARRDEALYVRWELAVHRDALGFFRQDDVETQFPIPTRPPR